ncbi:EamA family transporter [Candidatus Sumerlaeota bacterium]|nr:EamA family transporter [Candidatus Sumerlaeota bacterium]
MPAASNKKTNTAAILAFATVSIAWGTTYAGMRVAVESIPPFLMAGIRFTLAGACMMLAFHAMGHPFPKARDWARLGIVGCLLLAGANGLLAWAEQYLESSFAALLVNTAPLMIVGGSALLGEKVSMRAWLGLLIGFFGVFVLILPSLYELLSGAQPIDAPRQSHFWWAVGALVLGPICWAAGTITAIRVPAASTPFMTAATQTFLGGLGAMAIAALHGDFTQPFAPTMRSLWAVLYLIAIGSWLGYVSYMYCTLKMPPQVVATTTYLNVVVAALVGTMLLGERISPPMIIGGATVLAGVAITNLTRKKPGPAGKTTTA